MSEVQTFEVQNVSIAIPAVKKNPSGYQSKMIANCRFRTCHVKTINRVKQALMLKSIRLKDGKLVDSSSTALCWILEQIEHQAPEEKISETKISENEKTKIEIRENLPELEI